MIKEFENFFKKELCGSKGYKLTKDGENMCEVFPVMLKLQNEKGKLYGRSYAKHGDFSIFFNLERKWDRIQNIMEVAMKDGIETLFSDESGTKTETFVDTLVDLAVYSMMWVGYIKEKRPEEWEKFIKTNTREEQYEKSGKFKTNNIGNSKGVEGEL